jgi:hypothetical protein
MALKKNLIFLSAAIIWISCNKSNNTSTPPVVNTLVKTFSVYYTQSHTKNVTMFSYQQTDLLASLREYGLDTINGIASEDSLSLSFKVTDASTPPASLDATYSDFQTPPAVNSYQHLLTYDGQNRLVLDSVTSSTNNNNTFIRGFYDALGNTTLQWFYPDASVSSGYALNQIDTLFIPAGDIQTEINYSVNQGAQNYNYINTATYSSTVNPLYNQAISKTLGCMLVFSQLGDYISNHLPTQVTRQQLGSATTTVDYVWTTDGTGKVVSGTGSDHTTSQVVEIYNFTY